MADVVGTTQLYLQNLVAREFAPHLRVTHFYVENVRTYQAAPTALRVSQAYLESVRSRQDAPVGRSDGERVMPPLAQPELSPPRVGGSD